MPPEAMTPQKELILGGARRELLLFLHPPPGCPVHHGGHGGAQVSCVHGGCEAVEEWRWHSEMPGDSADSRP